MIGGLIAEHAYAGERPVLELTRVTRPLGHLFRDPYLGVMLRVYAVAETQTLAQSFARSFIARFYWD